ncbi:glycoside hydrolase family 19 protein [Burkholderia multivorans]|uniref:glycoside hydrolase family 19 protein n=1 Tax=Burkholderia multivorans TaxID=87883 RepID=UPI001904B110|nr:glycoside hydrolase family 19 protein [Burkholderia multivorans]MBJ9941709.1 glycoside hydrolase family 19 protein [Burkholderia multivorans]MBU9286880.1 glycoside hydrolase family 19 protein [Burkholderia multivorans]
MTSRPAPKKPPTPAPAKLKPLSFAFPFLRKGRGKSEASAQFTDEHEIYRLLAEREPSGAYLVSRKGMWHGGIHVTEAGAGQSLDLDAGLRCIADGVLIAFRANKTYPLSEITATGGGSPVQAPYSTGFALVRHTMEFPRGTKLTFYSLYMHLMSKEDYANFPKRAKPSYWWRQWKVTPHAQDKPLAGRNGQAADSSQQGLPVRKKPNGPCIGIVPQGASVSIGKRETVRGKEWGKLADLHGASLYPPEAGGYVEPSHALDGWIYLGQENGGPLVEEVYPDSMFDRVIVTANQTCTKGNPEGDGGIPVKAGDLMGHLGRYDSLNQNTSGTRMAHIEVFCDDSIQSFLEQGRAWVNEHGPHKEDWATLGLPSEPTILRIAPGTVLYQRTEGNKFVAGADPQSRKTDAVQVYSLAELARDPKRRVSEPHPNPNPGYPVNWWHVDGVNAQGQPIEGWVCDFNHVGGRVTREFALKWIDFECLADVHDPAHTIFATTQTCVEYASGANAADLASRSKLSPLMLKVYDALFTRGDGKQAADELCTLAQTERGGHPWLMQAASRLIVRHESEWANPSKWKQLIAELEKQTGPKPRHGEEQKRIDKLAWWDDVKAGVPGFPGPEVFHIHPVSLVGNFASPRGLTCAHCGSDLTVTSTVLQKIFSRITTEDAAGFAPELNSAFEKFEINTCHRVAHFFGQCEVECGGFTVFRENLRYKDGNRLWDIYRSALTAGLKRIHPDWETPQMEQYTKTHLINNDQELGVVLFGDNANPLVDYRGRGLLHLTWHDNYARYKETSNIDVVADPLKVEADRHVATDSSAWYWANHAISQASDSNNVKAVTKKINPALKDFGRRKAAAKLAFSIINQGRMPCSQDWSSTMTGENGW